jgi:hypothetical protein
MVRDEEVASIQDTLADTRTLPCAIMRLTYEDDPLGGVTGEWELSEVTVCRRSKDFQPPVERVVGGGVLAIRGVRFALPVDVVVYPSDRFVVEEVTYEVTDVDAANSVTDHERIVHAVLLTN